MKPIHISPDSIVSWSEDTVATDVNDEIVLMSMQRNRCYGLGASGSEIWRKMNTPIRVGALITELQQQFEAPGEQIESDVLATLADLLSEGLIQVRPAA